MNETEVNSRLVRACVERTDQTVMAKAETDKNVESLRTELGTQNKGLGEAQVRRERERQRQRVE